MGFRLHEAQAACFDTSWTSWHISPLMLTSCLYQCRCDTTVYGWPSKEQRSYLKYVLLGSSAFRQNRRWSRSWLCPWPCDSRWLQGGGCIVFHKHILCQTKVEYILPCYNITAVVLFEPGVWVLIPEIFRWPWFYPRLLAEGTYNIFIWWGIFQLKKKE